MTNFAPGVLFNEELHEYFLNGKILSGVTKKIAKRLGIKMPDEFVGEARDEGLHIHKAVQEWINTGVLPSTHPGALWVQGVLSVGVKRHSEVLVSDLKQYASSVDIVEQYDTGYVLYDIKRSFNRVYVTWQLSIYKYLMSLHGKKLPVMGCYCLAVRDRDVYKIYPYSEEEVKGLLYEED